MSSDPERGDAGPCLTLYHASSSYYSTIARLALAEKGIDYLAVIVDILLSAHQTAPWFARLNPAMTVPVLVDASDGEEVMRGSDIILAHLEARAPEPALIPRCAEAHGRMTRWVERHYRFPVDILTFSSLLKRFPPARVILPRKLGKQIKRLAETAQQHPELAGACEARIEVFEARREALMARETLGEMLVLMRQELADMEQALGDTRWLAGDDYSQADLVYTCFLARLSMIGRLREALALPGVAAFWHRVRERPSFSEARVWTRLKPLHVLSGWWAGRRTALTHSDS